MTNFDFLFEYEYFRSFASVAVAAENILHIDLEACVLNCRRAMEFALKWMYQVDNALKLPKQDTLVVILRNDDLKEILGMDLWRRLDFIRKTGNSAAHAERTVTEEQAEICLENLFDFCDFLSYCYGDHYEEKAFDYSLLTLTPEEALSFVTGSSSNMRQLRGKTNQEEDLSDRRKEQQKSYVPKPLDLANGALRQIYREIIFDDPEDVDEEAWIDLFDDYDV